MAGVDVSKLKSGTKLNVLTINTVYFIEVVDDGKIKVKGGKYFPEVEEALFGGSNWGGWMEEGMRMEFRTSKRRLITSEVQMITVVGDSWEYTL